MSDRFISHAQNGEDVVLWRALGHVRNGFYIDVGANHPAIDSVTRSLYDRGWRGVTVEPIADYVALHAAERPRDQQVQAIVTDRSGDDAVLHEFPGTGLSTVVDEISARHARAGLDPRDVRVTTTTLDDIFAGLGPDLPVHVLSVDVEGAEDQVLAGLDLTRHRPWVMVIESRAPVYVQGETSAKIYLHERWEPGVLAAGYRFCLNDGLSRFYVADERAAELAEALSYSACVVDDYTTAAVNDLGRRLEVARHDAIHWRALVLHQWADSLVGVAARRDADQSAALERELAALRGTLSWRVTKPLRWARVRQLSRPRP